MLEIIQNLFKKRTKFLGQSGSFLEAFELCKKLWLIVVWLMLTHKFRMAFVRARIDILL